MSEGSAAASQRGVISVSEVQKHNKQDDIWMILHGKVYDLTSFINDHPGGQAVLMQQAGSDGTSAFSVVHSKDVLSMLDESAELGEIDASSVDKQVDKGALIKELQEMELHERKPPLEQMLNTYDFESVGRQSMSAAGWAYYTSGSDDEITLRENHSAFQRIWLKPRILVNVKNIDMSTKLFNDSCSFPLYVSATALGKLAHPSGEIGIINGAYQQDTIYMLPTLASCSLDDMIEAKQNNKNSVNWMQLYVNADRQRTLNIIKKAENAGCRALCITVDAPMLGRRERDMRHKFTTQESSQQKGDQVNRNQGVARAISSFIDPSLAWSDLEWFKSNTSMHIVLKGVQCGEDAVLAYKHGVSGIILSNHGGRQIDGARSGIEILPEVIHALKSINYNKAKFEIYVDGGIRRGTDIFKAIAMGANGVGIGRPTLWGLAGYGADGVSKVLQLLKEELAMCMALMGTPTIRDINSSHVDISSLSAHIAPTPQDWLTHNAYQPMQPASLAKSTLKSNL